MTITFSVARKAPVAADVVVLGVFADPSGSRPIDLDWPAIEARGFESKVGQVQVVSSGDGRVVSRALLAVAGLGPATELNATVLRKVGAAIGRTLRKHATIAVPFLDELPESVDTAAAAQALAEGIVLGAYGYDAFKSDPKPAALTKVVVVSEAGRSLSAPLRTGAAIAGGVTLARDLINEPGGSLTPPALAKRAAEVARAAGLTVRVLDLAAIKRLRLGGLLGVNRGSVQPPQFVEIEYKPTGRPTGTLAFVGKGITFDSGGLSLKTGAGMMTMKCDMSGAAAVIGAMSVLPEVAPKVRVIGYLPITDNMTDGDATRPGDILRIRNGKTVEVLNTDAEGRLILADALVLASEARPDAIVDLATLTGACLVALGPSIAGLMGNDQAWNDQVRAAADRVGERLWPLPLPEDYRKMLDSPVADLKNIGGPHGGALTAGLFLREFVGEGIPWVHLDIAGPAFNEATEDGEIPKGGTGFGVRTLIELARTFAKS
jgi:leucyl aminopeptidase